MRGWGGWGYNLRLFNRISLEVNTHYIIISFDSLIHTTPSDFLLFSLILPPPPSPLPLGSTHFSTFPSLLNGPLQLPFLLPLIHYLLFSTLLPTFNHLFLSSSLHYFFFSPILYLSLPTAFRTINTLPQLALFLPSSILSLLFHTSPAQSLILPTNLLSFPPCYYSLRHNPRFPRHSFLLITSPDFTNFTNLLNFPLFHYPSSLHIGNSSWVSIYLQYPGFNNYFHKLRPITFPCTSLPTLHLVLIHYNFPPLIFPTTY